MRLIVCALVLSVAVVAEAQSPYTLQIVRPLPVGAAGTGWDAANPIYRAYQGMPYVRTIDVRGGTWPYTFTITSDSSGALSVVAGPCTGIGLSCTAGTLTLTNPTADFTYAVRVTDALGATANSGTISVDVNTNVCDSIGGWCFVDADAGPGGDGNIGTPYDAISDVWNSTNRADRIIVLRESTPDYVVTGMTQTDADDCAGRSPSTALTKVSWNESTRPVAWIGYPGETPVIDFAFDDNGLGNTAPCMELTGQNVWLQNFEAKNLRSIGFKIVRSDSFGGYIQGVYFHNLEYGGASANSCFLEFPHTAGLIPTYWDTITMSRFETLRNDLNPSPDGTMVKFYDMTQSVVSYSHWADDPITADAAIAFKDAFLIGTVLANTSDDIQTTFGGNLNNDAGAYIAHNLVQNCGTAGENGCISLGGDGLGFPMGPFTMHRNTFVGRIYMAGIDAGTDGPWTWGTNVIVNSGGSGSAPCPALRAVCSGISDYSRIVDSGNNLVGAVADGIVNAAGELQGAYLSYLGTRGWQVTTPSGSALFRLRRTP